MRERNVLPLLTLAQRSAELRAIEEALHRRFVARRPNEHLVRAARERFQRPDLVVRDEAERRSAEPLSSIGNRVGGRPPPPPPADGFRLHPPRRRRPGAAARR